MKVLIADDEPLARALLRALIGELPGMEIIGEGSDGLEAVELARAQRPDLVFLDINMPGQSGVHAALEIAKTGVEVIFVTAHEEHAVDAFDMGAVDYILKPLRRPRLVKAVERASRRFHARLASEARVESTTLPDKVDSSFWVPVRNGTVRVAIGDIMRVEAAGDLVYLHTLERAHFFRITMSELEKRLQGSGLVRIHRSAFIRPDRVVETRRHGKVIELVLDDGTRVPIGPRFRAAALAHIEGFKDADALSGY